MSNRLLAKNLISIGLANVVPTVFNLVLFMVVARILLSNGLSIYNTAISFAALFAFVADMGLITYYVREASKKEKLLDEFGDWKIAKGLACVIFFIVTMAATFVFPYTDEMRMYIAVAALSQCITGLSAIYVAYFQAKERLEHFAVASIIQSVTMIVLGYLMVNAAGLPGLMMATVLSSSTVLVYYIYMSKDRDWNVTPRRLLYSLRLFQLASPFLMYSAMYSIYTFSDRVILSVYRMQEVSFFTVPYIFVMSLQMASSIFASAAFTRFSKTKDLRPALGKCLKYILAMVIPASVGMCVLADKIIYTFVGVGFDAAVLPMRILTLALICISINVIVSVALNASGRERISWMSMLICAIITILLNVALDPIYGAVGAATAFSLGSIGMALLPLKLAEDEFLAPFGLLFNRDINKIASASLLMGVIVFLVPTGNMLSSVALGIIIYLAAFVFMRVLNDEDIKILRSIVK